MTDDKTPMEETAETTENLTEKVTLHFPYSDILRDRLPKAFEVAENVATKWKNNEKFENIGLSNPLAEIATVKTLEKAKQIEKKLEEKGVFAIAKVGTEIAKTKISHLFKKI
jgi:hypothetical protein